MSIGERGCIPAVVGGGSCNNAAEFGLHAGCSDGKVGINHPEVAREACTLCN